MLLLTTPCYSPIHSFLCSRTSNVSHPRVKTKIHVTANKALVQGSPLPLFLSPTTGLATLMGTHHRCPLQGLCTHCPRNLESVFLQTATGLAPPLHYCLYSNVLSSVRTSCPSNTRLHLRSHPSILNSSTFLYFFLQNIYHYKKWVTHFLMIINYSFIYYLTPPSRVRSSWKQESVCFVLCHSSTHGRACSLFLNEWIHEWTKSKRW